MRKAKWIVPLVVFVALAAASFGAARLVAERPADEAAEGVAVLHDFLELTSAQRQEVEALDARYEQERPELTRALLDARSGLLEVMRDPRSTRQEAVEAADRFGDAQSNMQRNTISYTYELRECLTPEQREKLTDTMGRGMCSITCGPGMGRAMGGRGRGPCGGYGGGRGPGGGR